MNRTYRSMAIAGLGAIALAGCAGLEVGRTPTAASGGTPFTSELHAGYLNLAKGEYAEADYKDSDYFARRAQRAGRGEGLDPQTLNDRLDTSTWPTLPAGTVAELVGARDRLMTELPAARTASPAAAARAQIAFDCWMQEQEENFQPDDIAACRGAFNTAMAEMVPPQPAPRAAAPAAAPSPRAEAPAPTPQLAHNFLVFFDWDSATLTTDAKSVIDTAMDSAAQNGPVTMVVTGHTDLSGPDRYNLGLSQRRADAVKAELVRLGTPANEIGVAARGETDPLVSSGQVREPQNRRVQIVLN